MFVEVSQSVVDHLDQKFSLDPALGLGDLEVDVVVRGVLSFVGQVNDDLGWSCSQSVSTRIICSSPRLRSTWRVPGSTPVSILRLGVIILLDIGCDHHDIGRMEEIITRGFKHRTLRTGGNFLPCNPWSKTSPAPAVKR